jgi:hypothetical protein
LLSSGEDLAENEIDDLKKKNKKKYDNETPES